MNPASATGGQATPMSAWASILAIGVLAWTGSGCFGSHGRGQEGGSGRREPGTDGPHQPGDATSQAGGAAGSGPAVGLQPPGVEGATHTEVWVGMLDRNINPVCAEHLIEDPYPPGADVVLVMDVDGQGGTLAASLLLGPGQPPSPPSDEPRPYPRFEHAYIQCGGVILFHGFEYAAQTIEDDGQRLTLGFAPMDIYRSWCRAQTPIPEGSVGGNQNYACRIWDGSGDASAAQYLCSTEEHVACRCDVDGCDLSRPLIRIDFVRSDSVLDGVVQGTRELHISGGVPRMLLQRVR